jgi:hypothetical protein
MTSLGITGVWAGRFQEAARRLERGVALARRIGRPSPEFTGLAHPAARIVRSYARAADAAGKRSSWRAAGNGAHFLHCRRHWDRTLRATDNSPPPA